jgi:hypothetical protein
MSRIIIALEMGLAEMRQGESSSGLCGKLCKLYLVNAAQVQLVAPRNSQ